MTDNTRLLDVKFGLHTDANTFDNTPGTVSIIECMRAEGLMPRQRTPLERDLYAVDGARFPASFGTKDLGPVTLGMHFRGVDSNSDGGAFTVQTSMEQARMLDAIFGTAAAAIVGDAVTVADGASGATALEVSDTTIANGDMILVPTAAGSDAREVVSGGGTVNLVVDRNFSATPTVGGTVVRAARWNLNTALSNHVHGYLRAEGESWRRDYFGLMCESLDLALPIGGYVEMNTTWQPTNWTDVAEANPSYAAPTAGQPIVVANAPLYIGNTQFLLEEGSIAVRQVLRARRPTSAANGVHGYVVTRKHDVMISGRILVGDNAGSFNELVDDSGTPSLGDLLGEALSPGAAKTTRDVGLQIGTDAGASMLARIPAAEISGSVVEADGLAAYNFTATATRPSSGSAFRLGVF